MSPLRVEKCSFPRMVPSAAWSHSTHAAMTSHPSPSAPTDEAAFILNDGLDFLIRQEPAEGDHGSFRTTVLDDPKEFPFGSMTPESTVVKIAGLGG